MTARDYITRAGWQALREEADRLWRKRRPAVVRALADAAAEGDRSENAEYIYRKKELREIDRRLRYLGRRLEQLVVVNRPPDDPGRVFFGARVTVVDEPGNQRSYRIVGADETHAGKGWISLRSPMARALLGKCVGNEVQVGLPGGEQSFSIEAIDYPNDY